MAYFVNISGNIEEVADLEELKELGLEFLLKPGTEVTEEFGGEPVGTLGELVDGYEEALAEAEAQPTKDEPEAEPEKKDEPEKKEEEPEPEVAEPPAENQDGEETGSEAGEEIESEEAPSQTSEPQDEGYHLGKDGEFVEGNLGDLVVYTMCNAIPGSTQVSSDGEEWIALNELVPSYPHEEEEDEERDEPIVGKQVILEGKHRDGLDFNFYSLDELIDWLKKKKDGLSNYFLSRDGKNWAEAKDLPGLIEQTGDVEEALGLLFLPEPEKEVIGLSDDEGKIPAKPEAKEEVQDHPIVAEEDDPTTEAEPPPEPDDEDEEEPEDK